MKSPNGKTSPSRNTRALVIAAAELWPTLTQSELARKLGVSRQRVGQLAQEECLTFATFNRRTTRPHAAPAAPMHGAENE